LLERLAMLQGNDPAAALLDAERIHQLQLVAEKEERVRLLYRQTGRRMRNRDLARGWKAWLERWQAKTYARNSLRRVAKRLRAPSIASHFEFWSAELAQAKMRGLFQAARARERTPPGCSALPRSHCACRPRSRPWPWRASFHTSVRPLRSPCAQRPHCRARGTCSVCRSRSPWRCQRLRLRRWLRIPCPGS
jgi:hypothetical protein